jgi:hypothetical protein
MPNEIGVSEATAVPLPAPAVLSSGDGAERLLPDDRVRCSERIEIVADRAQPVLRVGESAERAQERIDLLQPADDRVHVMGILIATMDRSPRPDALHDRPTESRAQRRRRVAR